MVVKVRNKFTLKNVTIYMVFIIIQICVAIIAYLYVYTYIVDVLIILYDYTYTVDVLCSFLVNFRSPCSGKKLLMFTDLLL